ncbi:MAG: CDP-archaeol synthase [Candidatus Woesearchaeota archaeon]
MAIVQLLAKTTYFMLPAIIANITPVFFRRLHFLDYPIDFNLTFKGKPLLGKNKTFRGMFFGTLAAILVAYLQYLFSNSWLLTDYSHWFVIGFLLGFGALTGDFVESFFKRRLGIKPGRRFFPWDQIDFVVGSLLFVSLSFVPTWPVMLSALIIIPLGTIVVAHLGYYLHLRAERW